MSITPSRTRLRVSGSSVSAPAMPGSASAKGRRLSSGPRGSWPEAMTSIVPSASAARTACGPLRCAAAAKAVESAEIAERHVGQHEVGRGNARSHLHAARLGRAHQIERGSGRDLPEVQPRAGQFRQHRCRARRPAPRPRRGGGEAQPRRHLARRGDHLPVRPPSSAWVTTTSPASRNSAAGAASCPNRRSSAARWPPPARRHRASGRFRRVPRRPARAVAAASGWTHRSGLPDCAANRTAAGLSSTGP
jgi:hypothetical protein